MYASTVLRGFGAALFSSDTKSDNKYAVVVKCVSTTHSYSVSLCKVESNCTAVYE